MESQQETHPETSVTALPIRKSPWENYCWSCHRVVFGNGEKKSTCDKCHHVFHSSCGVADSICSDCNAPRIEEREIQSDDYPLLELLATKWFDDDDFVMIDKKICSKPLTSIRSKIDGNEYKYFSTLMEEIKWSVHKTIASFSKQDETVAVAQRFQNYCINRIEMMQTCGACCENALMNPSEYASMVCNGAHLVLWARFIDSRYWPSKLMTIDGSDVKVWFFGHHSFADVSRTDCLRYSAERPETNENTGDTDKFADALKEADAYIKNLKKSMAYNDTDANEPFHPEDIQNHSVALISEEPQASQSLSITTEITTSIGPCSTPIVHLQLIDSSQNLLAPPISPVPVECDVSPPHVRLDESNTEASHDESNVKASEHRDINENVSLEDSNREESNDNVSLEDSNREESNENVTSHDESSAQSEEPCENPKKRKASYFQAEFSKMFAASADNEIDPDLNALLRPHFQEIVTNSVELLTGMKRLENYNCELQTQIQRLTREMNENKNELELTLQQAVKDAKRCNELEAENQRLKDEMAKQKEEWESKLQQAVDKAVNDTKRCNELEAENQRLKDEMAKQKEEWESKLQQAVDKAVNDTKREQWCLNCNAVLNVPVHCSRLCQQLYWRDKDGCDAN